MPGASLRAHVQHAGRSFDERSARPCALSAELAFELVALEEGRAGALRFEARPRAWLPRDRDVPLKVHATFRGGAERDAEAILSRGREGAGVLLEVPGAASGKGAGRDGPFPIRVRLRAALESGEAIEEHVLERPARGDSESTKAPTKAPTRRL